MARGSIVKRASGSYAIRYYGPDGKRRYETIGPNRRDAERALTVRQHEVDSGTWREPSQETLAEFAARWLERRRPRLAESTWQLYEANLRLHVLPRIGGRTLGGLRPEDIDGLVARLEGELSSAAVRNCITPLRKLLADATRHDVIASNPAARCELPPPQQFAGKEIPHEHSQAIRAALLEAAPDDPFRPGKHDLIHAHLFDVALGTGMRLGELRALAWDAIHREQRLIRVEHAYSRAVLKTPKSQAGTRSVPVFATVEKALEALSARALDRGRYAPGALVFGTDPDGRPFWPSNFSRRVWRPALKRASLAEHGYRFHDLRHTAVSRLIAEGADIKLVQTIAGHSSPATTLQRYAHLLDSRVYEAASKFDPGTNRAPKHDTDSLTDNIRT